MQNGKLCANIRVLPAWKLQPGVKEFSILCGNHVGDIQ